MFTLAQFAQAVTLTDIKQDADRYTQIAVIKDVINQTSQKVLATDRDTIDDILDILYTKYNFQA
jgi:hypothetical protein